VFGSLHSASAVGASSSGGCLPEAERRRSRRWILASSIIFNVDWNPGSLLLRFSDGLGAVGPVFDDAHGRPITVIQTLVG